MKIYTKTGDDGLTGLLGSRRLPKDDVRIEAYGTVDELNASLGVARASGLEPDLDALVARLQDELFVLGAALADPDPNGKFHSAVGADRVEFLEQTIDALEAELSPLTRFILPAGTPASVQIHLARAVSRRAERRVVKLARQTGEHVPPALIVYLNRLSDLLFVLARVVNTRAGGAEAYWSGL